MTLVLTQTDAGVAVITLNRPKQLNALNLELAKDLAAAVSAAAHESSVRCVVVRGAGGCFSVGGDLNMLQGIAGEANSVRRWVPRQLLNDLHQTVIAIRTMAKPVVAAIEGVAAGGALSLALTCDYVIMEEKARLTYAYDALGISPDAGGSYVWPRLLGERAALELAFFGGQFSSSEALTKGLINRVVSKADFEREVASIAGRLAQGPTLAFGKVKRLIYASLSASLAEQLEAEAADVGDCLVSDDFTEALRAFLEKRTAKFSGH